MPRNYKQKHKVAATQIQKVWRGYRTRKAQPKPPKLENPIDYNVLITGNEVEPSFPFDKAAGHFVYVGTGGLANLTWLANIAAQLGQPENGYTGIPKMFIVDISSDVQRFWETMKRLTAKAKTFAEFLSLVNAEKQTLASYCYESPIYGVGMEIVIGIMGMGRFRLPTENEHQTRYTFFRNVISKLTFIPGDFSDPGVFEYIKKVTDPDVPRYVYVSNIVEFMAEQGYYSPAANTTLKKIIQNTVDFEATAVIHSRTTLARSIEKSPPDRLGCCPDTFMFFPKYMNMSAAEQYAYMDNEDFIPLDNGRFQEIMFKRMAETDSDDDDSDYDNTVAVGCKRRRCT